MKTNINKPGDNSFISWVVALSPIVITCLFGEKYYAFGGTLFILWVVILSTFSRLCPSSIDRLLSLVSALILKVLSFIASVIIFLGEMIELTLNTFVKGYIKDYKKLEAEVEEELKQGNK